MDMQVPAGGADVKSEIALWHLGQNCRAVIIGFDGAMPLEYSSRLSEMGFHIGESVTCLLRPGFGCPRVYRVSNTVYSLDEDLAAYIRVAADV